jgi:hypothetical protein
MLIQQGNKPLEEMHQCEELVFLLRKSFQFFYQKQSNWAQRLLLVHLHQLVFIG